MLISSPYIRMITTRPSGRIVIVVDISPVVEGFLSFAHFRGFRHLVVLRPRDDTISYADRSSSAASDLLRRGSLMASPQGVY